MINDLGIELDELRGDNNLLRLLEAASQARATDLQDSADKVAEKLMMQTGRYDTFRERKAVGIRRAREGAMEKVLAINT